jgi:light-regulated signal transduction histidine kinase (bacteriophytochrome)
MKRFPVPHGVLAQDLVPLIAHDLRPPITAIKDYGQLVLRQGALPPKVETYLSSLVDEANHMASLIDDLVLVSQLERGEVPVQPGLVDLTRLLRRVTDGPVLSRHQTTPTLCDASESVVAYCDPNVTRRAIVRFIQCAVKYSRMNESCQVGTRRDGKESIVWVGARTKYGNGSTPPSTLSLHDSASMPDEDLSRHDLRTYICAKLAELQGGYVLGDTRLASGDQFCLVLPSGPGFVVGRSGG